MFRRWRRARLAAQSASHVAAPAPRPTAADLRGEQLFELVNQRLGEFLGPNGGWSVVRRSDGDTDRIFHAVLTHQIAAELTRAILDERDSLAVVVDADDAPLAFGWEPAPLVVWAEPALEAEPTAEPTADTDAPLGEPVRIGALAIDAESAAEAGTESSARAA